MTTRRVIELPLTVEEWAAIELPLPMTVEMWARMEAILAAMKPALVEATPIISPPAEQAPLKERAIYDGNYSPNIPSIETPEEEPADERHDEPLRVSLHEVPPADRSDAGVDAQDDRWSDAPEPVLPGGSDDGGGQQQEPLAEDEVRAEPTMTPEELVSWEAQQKRQPKGAALPSTWTPERRQAARDRALGQGLGSKVNKHVAKTPSIPGSGIPELTDLSISSLDDDSPLDLPDEETDALLRMATPEDSSEVRLSPEEAAHEDAAIILAEMEPEPQSSPSPRRGGATTDAPSCECPQGWLKNTELWMATDRCYSNRHAASCPLHRHRHRFGNTPDAKRRLVGHCECGDVEYRPIEPERSLHKKQPVEAS